jgi:hypothetical protein
MKSTANRTRPKIIKAGIVGLTESLGRESLVAGGLWRVRLAFSNVQIAGHNRIGNLDRALSLDSCLRMIFSENRFTLFRIMR